MTMNNDEKELENDLNEAQVALKKMFKATYQVGVEVLPGGRLPDKKRQTDAGFDLYATEDVELRPGEVIKHPLNIKLQLPCNTYAEITTKSGLGAKGFLVYAGIIDEEYRGIPHVLVTNIKNPGDTFAGVSLGEKIIIKKGEKIAQLIMHPHSTCYLMEQVEKVDTDTDRSDGGFGSTGA